MLHFDILTVLIQKRSISLFTIESEISNEQDTNTIEQNSKSRN
jgi:hypothetical protein